VAQIVITAHRHLWSCMHRRTDEPSPSTKTRSIWLIDYGSKSPTEKVGENTGIFKPAEPHSPWVLVCFLLRSVD